MKKIFEAKVIQVGPEAQNMIQDANMLILFGEEAPEDLAEYCFKMITKICQDQYKKVESQQSIVKNI